MKKRIRLTEGDLHRIVKESVKKILKEDSLEDVRDKAEKICQRIRNGKYDNVLHKIMRQGAFEFFKIDDDYYWEEGKMIDKAAKERKCIIDKNYAFRYGDDDTTYDKDDIEWDMDYGEIDWNPNINDTNKYRAEALNNYYWK